MVINKIERSLSTIILFTCMVVPHFCLAETSPVEKIIKRSGLLGATDGNSFGMALVDLETKQTKEEYQGQTPLPWASVCKMLSLYYSLSILGPKSTFQTELLTTSEGDLILKGGGDPSLNTDGLINMAFTLKSKGISKITGHFFYDESGFTNQTEISHFGQGDDDYDQSLGALNVYFNRLQLIRTSEGGFRPIPPLPNFRMNLDAENLFPPGQRFKFLDNNDKLEDWLYSNRKSYSHPIEIPVKNPNRATAEVFADLLRAMGIQVPAPELLPAPKSGKSLVIHNSIPTFELARSAIEYSNNLFTEAMMVKAARQATERPLNITESADAMLTWLKANAKNVPWGDIKMINASGLTADNRFGARTLAEWLANVYLTQLDKGSEGPHYYWALMPMAGENSGMRERWNHPKLVHRLWAKTGTLDFVQAIAGIFVARSGKLYSFSLTASNLVERARLDKGESIPQGKVEKFRKKAKQLFMDVVQDWYERY